MEKNIIQLVKSAAKKKILYLPHAVSQMNRPERMISTIEVKKVIEKGRVIEYYPEDRRGESCLILGKGEENRSIHVVCAPKEDFLAIITAYLPDDEMWKNNFSERQTK
jgi:hypothetical protein